MSNNVYVIGTDMIRFGRFENATPPGLAAQAALLALDDAGLSIKDIQAVYSGNCGETMVGQRMLQLIGQTGVPVVNVTNACATGATAFREAMIAIKAGVCDVALAVGSEKMGKGMLVRKNRAGEAIPSEGLAGSGTMPAVFSEMGMEHTRAYGTTPEQYAQVSVKNHFHSTCCPQNCSGHVPHRLLPSFRCLHVLVLFLSMSNREFPPQNRVFYLYPHRFLDPG